METAATGADVASLFSNVDLSPIQTGVVAIGGVVLTITLAIVAIKIIKRLMNSGV